MDDELLLCQAEASTASLRKAEFERLRIARDWALAHRPSPELLARSPLCATTLGAAKVLVLSFVEAELAAALRIHPLAARHLMSDGVDLHARLPQTWAATADGRLECWVARKIAAETRALDDDKAAWVDAQIADLLGTLPPSRLLTVLEARVKEADQELADALAAERAVRRGVWFGRNERDGNRSIFVRCEAAGAHQMETMLDHLAHLLRRHCPDSAAMSGDELRAEAFCLLGNPMAALKLLVGADEHEPSLVPDVLAETIRTTPPEKYRPRATCYVHLTPATLEGRGVARAEELGALTRQELVDLLGHHHVTLKPVIDLNDEIAADCYEVPAGISEQLHLARPADAFPYASSVSRRQDQDHTVPYDWTGPPGQTRLRNLGHLTRRHHRIKTFAGWRVWQDRGVFTWISPHGRIYLTDGRGTHPVEIHTGPASFASMLATGYSLAT